MQLRPFEPADQEALVDLWYESWLSVGLPAPAVTRADLARRVPGDLARRWTVTVAETGGRLAGFLAVCLEERRLDQLFIAPAAQGAGVGLALFEAALRQMPDGFWLATQPGNHRARAFYEKRGMSRDAAHPSADAGRLVYVFRP